MHNNNEQPLRGGASTTEGSPASLALAERLSKRGAVPASPAKRARQQQDDRGNSGDHQSAPPPGKRQRKRRVNRENGGASVLSQPAARHTGSTHNNKSLEGGDEAQAASRALFRQVLALRNNCLAALSQEDQLRIEIGSILSQARREAYLANPLFYITHKLLHSIKHHFSAEELTKIDLANVLSQAKLRASIEPLSFAPSFCWPSISNEHHMQAKQDTAYLKAREEWKLVSPEGVPKLPLEAALCSTEQAPTQLPDDTLIPEEIMTSKEEALRLQRLKVLNEMPMQKPKQYKRPPVIPERKKVKERREPKKEKLVDTVERKQMKGESNEGMNDKKRREFKTKAPQMEDTSMHWCFMQPLPVLPDPTSNVDLELLIPIGTIFMSRRELMVSGLHRPMQAGIWGGEYGAVSVVLSGGYSDVDWGHTIVYTGSGGFEPNSRVQTKDQEFTRANAGLKKLCKTNQQVRVIRGSQSNSLYAPIEGYRFDGFYSVERCWREKGPSGFLVCRYLLKGPAPPQHPARSGHPVSYPSSLPYPQQEEEDDSGASSSASTGFFSEALTRENDEIDVDGLSSHSEGDEKEEEEEEEEA